MDTGGVADQQFGRAFQSPFLHLLGPEGRDSDFADPDGQARDGADFLDLSRPFGQGPQVPIEGEPVHRYGFEMAQDPHAFEMPHPGRIDRRHTTEHPRDRRVLGPDRLRGQ